ncbi:beta-1,3-galactosyltransferase 2 isoform X2 [Ceratina calcarata]|uniref:Hexosyltransferase n=1 Tax=Ceratina calcarata TaxID=156304 RepID=A0AAJ7NGK2_9HYME|nr:beta-1,3-galactosyltransferase 2 isoform X2 [Ceratina calcarata]
MRVKPLFIIFCISTVLFLSLSLWKTNFLNTKLDLKYLHDASSNISLEVKFVVEPKCNPNFVIWIIASSANNTLYRAALRRAYPVELLTRLNVTRIFLLGIPRENYTQKYILEESRKYNDVLQGDFLESYRNLTSKHLMGLRWISNNCTATFLIKSDDDIVVDMFEILNLLHENKIKEDAISGYVLRNVTYPDFLSGWIYITGLKVARLLVRASEKFRHLFWIDDVFVTGILRLISGTEYLELNDLYATDYRYLECCMRDKKRKLKCEFIAGPDGAKKELHMKFREFSEYCRWNCFKRTTEQLVSKKCVVAYEERISVANSKAQVLHV